VRDDTDQVSAPKMIFDQTGSLANVSRHDYLPFGEELFAGTGGRTTSQGYSASDGVRQKFTSYEADAETGLNFAQARYQSSMQGRFTSADSVAGSPGNPQTFNLYSYVQNNPLTFTDLTGHYADGGPYFGNGRSFGEGVGLAGALNDPWSEIPWTVAGENASSSGSEPISVSEDEALALNEEILASAPQNPPTIARCSPCLSVKRRHREIKVGGAMNMALKRGRTPQEQSQQPTYFQRCFLWWAS